MPCYIGYLNEDGTQEIIVADRIVRWNGKVFSIRVNDQIMELATDRIVRSGKVPEELV